MIARWRVWALALLVGVVGLHVTGDDDAGDAGGRRGAGRPASRRAAPTRRRWARREGYPKGDRTTFYNIETAVGSHSHLDEIFPGRLVSAAPRRPRALARVAEPGITWRFQDADLTLDDYLARTRRPGC